MKNIWRLFVNDLRRITSNTVTRIILLGLILLPSIFSWYNVLACWDVFGNTDNLKVAVANTDEGYTSDLVPLEVNMGEQVVSSLRANDQLDWQFVGEDEAIEGARSGKYYAAVVIPKSFSQDMMTFYSDDMEHAKILYYSNVKKNVVAPKLTDQSADRVSYQVNEAFTEELSEVALGVAASLADYADSSGADGRLMDLAAHMEELGGQLDEASQVVTSYSAVLDSSRSLIEGSANLIGQTRAAADEVTGAVDEGKQAVSSLSGSMDASSDALAQALTSTAASYDGVADSVDAAFASAGSSVGTVASQLRAQADAVDGKVASMEDVLVQLKNLSGSVPDDYKPTVDALVNQMQTSIDIQKRLSEALRGAAVDVESGNADAQASHAEVKQIAQEARQSVVDLSQSYNDDVKPRLDDLVDQVSSLSASLSDSVGVLQGVGDDMEGSTDSLVGTIDEAQGRLNESANNLSSSADKMEGLAAELQKALSSDDIDSVRSVLNSDPETLATSLAAPVELDRQAVFPAENFGSQMAPLYTTLGLWIGSLLLVVAIKVSVNRKQRDELTNWKLHQLFLGRFGVFSVASTLQSITLALGNMLFLQVQVEEPVLYLLCFWVAGQVFTLICYTLVLSFANLGKAIAVFLLIIQVTSGGGSFPLPMLPDFFQALSPFLPATHMINAMRAAMMGVYQGDFWIELGLLLLFVIPFLLLGLALRRPLMRFLKWYVDKVEESRIVS